MRQLFGGFDRHKISLKCRYQFWKWYFQLLNDVPHKCTGLMLHHPTDGWKLLHFWIRHSSYLCNCGCIVQNYNGKVFKYRAIRFLKDNPLEALKFMSFASKKWSLLVNNFKWQSSLKNISSSLHENFCIASCQTALTYSNIILSGSCFTTAVAGLIYELEVTKI